MVITHTSHSNATDSLIQASKLLDNMLSGMTTICSDLEIKECGEYVEDEDGNLVECSCRTETKDQFLASKALIRRGAWPVISKKAGMPTIGGRKRDLVLAM